MRNVKLYALIGFYNFSAFRYNKRESTAYAASRIPSSYGATLRVFHEVCDYCVTRKTEIFGKSNQLLYLFIFFFF